MTMQHVFTKTFDQGDGREITIETGKLAKQANGSVVIKMGNTMLLATATATKEAKEGVDFLPLTVDYQEKYAAAGRFPGGFNKREARLSNYEILISRIIDRAIRPLFPDDFHNDMQVMVSLVSSDEEVMPDSLAGLAASAALTVSDIPFLGPISEVRVAKINGEFVINPSPKVLEEATIDMIVSGSMKDVNMVEGEMEEVSEAEMLEAIKIAHEAIKIQCQAQLDLAAECGKEKMEYTGEEEDEELYKTMNGLFAGKIKEIAENPSSKNERSDAFDKLLSDYMEGLIEEELEKEFLIKKYFGKIKKEEVRNVVLNKRSRLDGRQLDEVRDIWCEIDYLPSAHGSSVFTRGETQSLTTVTLGGKMNEQMIDGAVFQHYDKFILHYNFPSFSTGEVRPNRGPGRREIGHGNLALRALSKVVPTDENENPYTVRVVSDILESNGSSSMATVCAGSLALMDAGIKIKKPVSGIAMGLIHGKDGKYAVLSDILGDEDHLGDMDFKVTGTEDGITACQMDIKVDGLSFDILSEALEQAKRGRLHILSKMNEVISESKPDLKPHAPRIEKFTVENEFIGKIIGSGGKQIQQIQKETGAEVTIDENEDGLGVVEVSTNDKEAMEKAVKWIKGIIEQPELGKTYEGKVVSIVDFGAFVEILPGNEGLLHVSEYSYERTNSISDHLKVGDTLEVKLINIDSRSGKLKLSRKALLPKPEGYVERKPERRDNNRRDDRRPRGDRRDDRRPRGDRRDNRRD
jgi:polyribonucleotide nucleotidyltransferase